MGCCGRSNAERRRTSVVSLRDFEAISVLLAYAFLKKKFHTTAMTSNRDTSLTLSHSLDGTNQDYI